MTDKTDSKEREVLREAERLLRRDAESLRESHTSHANREDWTVEEEAKAGYDEYIRAADALAALDGRDSFAIGFPEGVSRDDTVHGRTYYTAENMAWASAKGFREGVASLAASAGSEPVSFTAEHVAYINRYGGRCRDCADEGGICPNRGLPCADAPKAIQFVLEALAYGINNGYINARVHPSPPEGAPDPQLLKFYGVTTAAALIEAQARHIERLQSKSQQTPSFAPRRAREG